MWRFRSSKLKLIRLLNPLVYNYVPRGFIFFIDTLVTIAAARTAFILIALIRGDEPAWFSFPLELWLLVGVQIVFIYILSSYSGLIRYSGLKDAIKLLKVSGFTVAAAMILNYAFFVMVDRRFFVTAEIIIFGLFSFFFLFFFRIFVKEVFSLLRNKNVNNNAFVLGVDGRDVDMASGLVAQNSLKYKMVGFISTGEKRIRKKPFGLPVFHIDDLANKRQVAGVVIVREDKLKYFREVPDVFSKLLDQNLKILTLPNLQDNSRKNRDTFASLREIKLEDLLQRSPIQLDKELISANYHSKTILVSGGAGSIGSEIIRQLIPFQPKKIIILDQAETPLNDLILELEQLDTHINFEKIIGNVRNQLRMETLFKTYRPDVVFHAAAYKHVPLMECNVIEALSTNFKGTRQLVDLSVKYNIEKFVFVSTDKAVNPTNIMGASKRAAEMYIQYVIKTQRTSTTFITTRFGNVLGSNGSVVPYFKKQIAAGGPITVTHPEITRYFMTIDEACQLVLQAGSMGNGGEIFVFDMGKPVKIVDLAKQMIRLSGLKPGKDIQIEYIGLRPGEKLYEELLADEENTSKTIHEQILIGNGHYALDNHTFRTLIQNLFEAMDVYNEEASIQWLQTLVPEFTIDSRFHNSRLEELV